MALTFDQFMTVVASSEARRSLGLTLTDEAASSILTDEAKALAFYQTWASSLSRAAVTPTSKMNGTSIAGFVFSLIGILTGLFPLVGIVASLLGVILSIGGLREIARHQQRGRGIAISGIVIGSLGLLSAVGLAMIGFPA